MNFRRTVGLKEIARLTALAMALTAFFSFVHLAGADGLYAIPVALDGSESNLQAPAVSQASVSSLQPLASSPANEDSLVTASLLTEFDEVQPGQTLLVGVHLDMEQDWYIYWQNPGDSGIPTSVRWNLPDGFEAGDLKWPYPTNFYTDSYVSYGYKGDVVLMSELSIPDDAAEGQSVNLSASVSWLVCKDVCIPGSAEISREVTVTHSAVRPDADTDAADSADVANSYSEINRDTEASNADARYRDRYTDRELLRIFSDKLPQSMPGLIVGFRTQSNTIILDLQHEKFSDVDVSELLFYASDEGVVESGAEQHFEITEGGLRITLRKSVFAGGDIESISGVLYNSSGRGENGTVMKAIYVASQ